MQLHIITWTEKQFNEDGSNKRAVSRCYKLTSEPFVFAPQIARHGGFKIEPVSDDQLQGLTALAKDGEYYLATRKGTFNTTFAKTLNIEPKKNTSRVEASDEQRVEFADAIGLDATGILVEIKTRILTKEMAKLNRLQTWHQKELAEVEDKILAIDQELSDMGMGD